MVTDKGGVRQLAHLFDSKDVIDLGMCDIRDVFFGVVALSR